MQGFNINVSTPDDLTGIQFRLYDNNMLVIDNIGAVDFDYLIQEPYEGTHTLDLRYFQPWNPTKESAPYEILSKNFTLPSLTLAVTYEIY